MNTKATIVYRNINARTTDYQLTFSETDEPLRPLGVRGEVWNNVMHVVGVFASEAEAKYDTDRYIRNVP